MSNLNTYEARINNKIDALSSHPKYEWLRKYADDALAWRTCCGFYAIKAVDFLDRVDIAPVELLRDWLDGKNNLEWDLIRGNTP